MTREFKEFKKIPNQDRNEIEQQPIAVKKFNEQVLQDKLTIQRGSTISYVATKISDTSIT